MYGVCNAVGRREKGETIQLEGHRRIGSLLPYQY
jgi:hypothetical protein